MQDFFDYTVWLIGQFVDWVLSVSLLQNISLGSFYIGVSVMAVLVGSLIIRFRKERL